RPVTHGVIRPATDGGCGKAQTQKGDGDALQEAGPQLRRGTPGEGGGGRAGGAAGGELDGGPCRGTDQPVGDGGRRGVGGEEGGTEAGGEGGAAARHPPAQQVARPLQPPAQGADAPAQRPGGFILGETLEVAQQQRGARLVRQPGQLFVE